MERKIIHIDMDAFYASVEQRDNPGYRGRPLAVGSPEARGVVSTASYEARRYGIRSAMPSVKAMELCPDLIFVKGRLEHYRSVSREIHRIFHDYTDLVEPLSLDEAFLDVTGDGADQPLAVDIAREIKKRIYEQTGLVASAGVSYNKFLAKIASDYRKPDGLFVIHPLKARDFIARLPIEAFWGIGKVTAHRMHALGIHNGRQLRTCSLEFLCRNFGKAGQVYHDFARGIDNRPVVASRARLSVGCERTFEKDLTGQTALIIALWHIADELVRRIRKSRFYGHTLTLKVRFADFTQRTHCCSTDGNLLGMQEILPQAKRLLSEMELHDYRIRLLGLSVSNPGNAGGDSGEGKDGQLEFDF